MGETTKTNSDIYQKVLELTLEWGDQWGDRVKDRIQQLHPNTTKEQIEKIAYECVEIKKHCHEINRYTAEKISESDFNSKIKAKYPNLSEQNIQKLFHYSHPKVENKKSTGKVSSKKTSTPKKLTFSKIFKKFFLILF